MIVCTVISNSTFDILQDAIASVETSVDKILFIDTGLFPSCVEKIKNYCGEKFLYSTYKWNNNFSDARNYALKEAHRFGATWAITLDSDERMSFDIDLREFLASTHLDVICIPDSKNSYTKERIFKLPSIGKWVGPTHEMFDSSNCKVGVVTEIQFEELEKTKDQMRQKVEFDIRVLNEYINSGHADSRWHFYLGESYYGAERYEDAIEQYQLCISKSAWCEEAGWASYKCAICYHFLDDVKSAIQAAQDGILRYPAMAELPCYIAQAHYLLGDYEYSVIWANIAISVGRYKGCGNDVIRIGFQAEETYWEQPYKIIYESYCALNMPEKAKSYLKDIEQASKRLIISS